MGLPVLILGESGSGKTSSMRNYQKGEILVLNVASKFLPFRSDVEVVQNCNYPQIAKALSEKKYKTYAIDDSQYLLCFELFDKAKEKGYEKFTDLAFNFYSLIKFIIEKLPKEIIVFLLHHTEETESGKIKAKTIGKMLDDKLTVEGLFSVVLLAETDENKHIFKTQTNGKNPVKTPIGLFAESEIDNDLKAVEKSLREYYKI